MSRPPRNRSSRRAKESRRLNARFRDMLERHGDRPLPPPPATGPDGRPTIPDSEVVGGSPRLVLVRCAPCGAPMRGVRRDIKGRLVYGVPWIELREGTNTTFAARCAECGADRAVRERDLIRRAAEAEAHNGKAQTIRA